MVSTLLVGAIPVKGQRMITSLSLQTRFVQEGPPPALRQQAPRCDEVSNVKWTLKLIIWLS